MKTSTFTLFLVSIVLFFSACALDKPVLPKSATSTTGTGTTGTGTTGTGSGTNTGGSSGYYFKGTLASQAFDWEVSNDNLSNWITGSESSLFVFEKQESGPLIADFGAAANNQQPEFQIEFYRFTVDSAASAQTKSTAFNSFIKPGSWSLATTYGLVDSTKTLVIDYTDVNGTKYYSAGPQPTKTANIISVTSVPADANDNESLKIKIAFTCTLYATDGSGKTIQLNNVDATVRLENLL
jgi:hypothetical protein